MLLLRGRQNLLDHQLGPVLESKAAVETDRRARIENVWLRRPGWVILLITVISLLCIPPSRRVGFDYNLLHMQSRGLPAVVFQDKLIHSSTRSVLFGAIVATNLVQATNLIAILTNLPTVSTVDSMAPYLVQDAGPKLGLLRNIKQIASEIHFLPVDSAPVDVKELDGALFGLHGYLKLVASKVENDPNLHEQVMSLRQSVSALRQRLLLDERAPTADKLARFQQALFNDVRDTFTTIQEQDDSGSLKAADLPETLRQRFIGVTGKYLLQVYPKRNVWDRKQQAAFVADLRTVDPLATGTPVQLLEYTTLLKESYEQAALYSLAAIAILVLIHFRRISCVFMSLLPVALGFLWMVGIMGLLGISFNPANIMTLPLVVGIGVTNGIHILNRFAEEQHPSILARSTGKAVLVSG
ncbi:MAG TPA: RND transporter, partial [Candidatus Dormibacteraeota bacterium]|nr:RND transporter [Candidatus Dormibacteraeota bacterium]